MSVANDMVKFSRMTALRPSGFTLLEMAIVLLIIGLMFGGLLMPLSERLNAQRYNETEDTLGEIKDALLGFALDQGRLPCPDTSGDGVENSPCLSVEGTVPWVTLGVGRLDSWQNSFRYRVDDTFSVFIPDPANTTSGLTITEQDTTPVSAANPDAPVAVIFSTGRDGLANDDNGVGGNALYIQDVPNDSAANYFDDVLIFISKNTLLNRMASAGKWP